MLINYSDFDMEVFFKSQPVCESTQKPEDAKKSSESGRKCESDQMNATASVASRFIGYLSLFD